MKNPAIVPMQPNIKDVTQTMIAVVQRKTFRTMTKASFMTD